MEENLSNHVEVLSLSCYSSDFLVAISKKNEAYY